MLLSSAIFARAWRVEVPQDYAGRFELKSSRPPDNGYTRHAIATHSGKLVAIRSPAPARPLMVAGRPSTTVTWQLMEDCERQ